MAAGQGSGSRRIQPPRSARSGVRSDVSAGCVVAMHRSAGADEAGKGASWAGPPPSRPPQLRCWPRQDDQRAQSKLVGKPLAALDQAWGVMSLLRTSGRLSRRLSAQGWAGHPSRSRRLPLFPGPVRVDASAGRVRNCSICFTSLAPLRRRAVPVVPQPIEQGPGHRAVPFGMVDRFPEAPISCSSRKAGLSGG